MRTRRWILVIALFVAFTALVIYHSWNLLKINERIKNYVLVKISPALGGECEIEKLDMALGAIHLKNVKVNFNDHNFSLWVDDVRVGISFTRLFQNGFHPQGIPHDILFIKPHLIIRTIPHIKSQKTGMDSTNLKISLDKYWEKVKDLNFIRRITISKGRISYADSVNQEFQLAHDINGWLNSKDNGYITARLVGKVFHSQTYNILMTAEIDAAREHLNLLNIKLNNYKWQEKTSFFIPDYFDIMQGTINASVSLTAKELDKERYDISGEVTINNGAIQFPGRRLYFDDINIKTRLDDWNCIIENSSFLFNGSPVVVSGRINNILSPRLDLKMKSNNFDLKKNIAYLATKSKINLRGYSNFSFQVTNTFNNPTIEGQITSQQIMINEKLLHQIRAKISFEDSIFQINELSCGLEGLKLGGNCEVDLSRKEDNVVFSIYSSGEISPKLWQSLFHSLENNHSQLRLEGKGNFSRLSGTVDFRLKFFSNPDTTFQFNGNFEVGNKKLSLSLNSPTHHFKGEGIILLSVNQPKYYAKLTGIHHLLYSFPELKLFQKIFNYKTTWIQIQRDRSDLRLTGDFIWNGEKDGAHRTANVTCSIKSHGEIRQLNANINISSGGEKFFSTLNVVKHPDYLKIKNFDIENLLHCNGQIYLKEEKRVEGNINFPNASLSKIGSLIYSNNKAINQGKLDGVLRISGTLTEPKLWGKLDLTDVLLNKIGFYDAGMNFQIVNEKLVLNELNIKRNQQPIFKCEGTYSFDNEQLNFNFLGNDIDLNSVVTIILNKPGLLRGKGSGELKLQGNASYPKLYGTINLNKGNLGPFSFSHISLDLGQERLFQSTDINDKLDSLEIGGVILRRILITRTGEFQIQGKGMIPFSSELPININLKGEGNILSVLPELTPFFKETYSRGEWTVNFTGRPDNIIISGGRLKLSEGYLRLGDVAPEIKNIVSDTELEQDGFLNVKFITGKINGKSFTFRNFRPDSILPDSNVESFSIPEFGLDLGIFTLETSSKGIPLHIPRLMAKGEIGQFVFSGKTEKERFYFAGPLEQPIIRGKIQLQNVNFTFPFITSQSADTTNNPIVEVLKNIKWNVTTIAGKDLHYQREIPSGVDNVYVDLIIDVGVGGLEFNGVIEENNFGVVGSLESSRGMVEYLDLDFHVIKAGVEFDMDVSRNSDVEFDKSTLLPIIYGEARTTVTDSTGYPYYIYLTLLTVDKETGYTVKRGRLGEVVFQLSTDNPNLGDTEGELLASLGYSASNIPKMATDIIGISTDNLVFRPLFRPFERQLERTLGLDMVRFSSRFTRNLIEMNLKEERNFQFDSKLFLLRSTKLMIGKYLAERLFLMYTGQLEAGLDYRYQQEGFGFRHTLGLEYRINTSLLLQMEYDYNSLLLWQKEDKKILLRYSFPF